MKAHTDKTQENKSPSPVHATSQKQPGEDAAFQLMDNRPEALARRRQQEEINDSPRVKQSMAVKEKINNSPRARQLKSVKAMTDRYAPLKTAQLMSLEEEEKEPVQEMFEGLERSASSEEGSGITLQGDSGTAQRASKNNTGLPDKLKTGIENLSGYAMDDVKVHYNSGKPAQLNAHAYAQGTNIHIAPGQEKHLPHEAWHVVQQKQGRVRPTKQLKEKVNINDDAGLEKEADVMGVKALQKKPDNKPVHKRKSSRQQEIISKGIAQREEEEEDAKTEEKKHKKEAAWKPVQLKKKPNFPNASNALENTENAPIQGEWINREEGPHYGLLQWKQTSKDTDLGHYLEDGWYKARLDFQSYWAIKLKDTEIEDIRAGRVMVWVRPWIVTMNYPSEKSDSAAGHTDLSLVFNNVREIWKQAKVGIQIDTPVTKTIKLSKEIGEYKSKEELTDEINNLLREDINSYIAGDSKKGREGIQAVFVPSYDRMGFTYRTGDKGYNGPVTFVSTGTIGVGGKVEGREDLSPSEYVNTAISVDAAHEIGHAFGLNHMQKQTEVQLLMHGALYKTFRSIESTPEKSEAIKKAKEQFSQYSDPLVFQSKAGGDKMYWTVMHGSEFTEGEIEIVLKNLIEKKIW